MEGQRLDHSVAELGEALTHTVLLGNSGEKTALYEDILKSNRVYYCDDENLHPYYY